MRLQRSLAAAVLLLGGCGEDLPTAPPRPRTTLILDIAGAPGLWNWRAETTDQGQRLCGDYDVQWALKETAGVAGNRVVRSVRYLLEHDGGIQDRLERIDWGPGFGQIPNEVPANGTLSLRSYMFGCGYETDHPMIAVMVLDIKDANGAFHQLQQVAAFPEPSTSPRPQPPQPAFPAILDFRADPYTIDRGRATTLSWQTAPDVDHCSIHLWQPPYDMIDRHLPPNGSIQVSPRWSTLYALQAHDADGHIRQTEVLKIWVRD